MQHCSTCHEFIADSRCNVCKQFAFCSAECMDTHPLHDDVCWDRASTDAKYVGETLFGVLPMMWDNSVRFPDAYKEHAVKLCMSLMDPTPASSRKLTIKGHRLIEDLVHDPEGRRLIEDVATKDEIVKLATLYKDYIPENVLEAQNIPLLKHYLICAKDKGTLWKRFKGGAKKYAKKFKDWRKRKKNGDAEREEEEDDDEYEYYAPERTVESLFQEAQHLEGLFDKDGSVDVQQYIALMLSTSAADMIAMASTNRALRGSINRPAFWKTAVDVRFGQKYRNVLRLLKGDPLRLGRMQYVERNYRHLFIALEALEKSVVSVGEFESKNHLTRGAEFILKNKSIIIANVVATSRRKTSYAVINYIDNVTKDQNVGSKDDYERMEGRWKQVKADYMKKNKLDVSTGLIIHWLDGEAFMRRHPGSNSDIFPLWIEHVGVRAHGRTSFRNTHTILNYLTVALMYDRLTKGYKYVDRIVRERHISSSIDMEDYYDHMCDDMWLAESIGLQVPLQALMYSHYEETGEIITEPVQLIDGIISNAKKLLTKKGRNEVIMQLKEWEGKADTYEPNEANKIMGKVKKLARDAKMARRGAKLLGKRGKGAVQQYDQIISKASEVFTALS